MKATKEQQKFLIGLYLEKKKTINKLRRELGVLTKTIQDLGGFIHPDSPVFPEG